MVILCSIVVCTSSFSQGLSLGGQFRGPAQGFLSGLPTCTGLFFANLVWGTGWVVLASFFLGSTFVLGGGSVAKRILVHSISMGLGRVAGIYHGTVRRECYQILLLLLLCYVIL